MTPAEKLAAYTVRDAATGCLRWTRSHNSRGYGLICFDGKSHLAHRVAYEIVNGPIPDGLQVDHVAKRGCRYKDCCEPTHLEAVTQLENQRRTEQATKTHCVRDHPLSGENLVIKQRANGRTIRNCRTCANDQARLRRFVAHYLDEPVPVAVAEPLSEQVAS